MNCKPSQDIILREANVSWVFRSKQERTEVFESLASRFAFRCSAFAQHDSATDEMGLAAPLPGVAK